MTIALTKTKSEIFVLYIHDICIVILSLPAVSALSTNSQSSSSSLDEPSSKVNAKSLVVLFFYDLRILIITCKLMNIYIKNGSFT